jgi:hypothetical protein
MEKNIGISPVLASKWNCNSPKIDEGYCSNPVSPASSCCERVPVSPYVGDAPHPLKVSQFSPFFSTEIIQIIKIQFYYENSGFYSENQGFKRPVSPASSCCEHGPVSPYVRDAPHPPMVSLFLDRNQGFSLENTV